MRRLNGPSTSAGACNVRRLGENAIYHALCYRLRRLPLPVSIYLPIMHYGLASAPLLRGHVHSVQVSLCMNLHECPCTITHAQAASNYGNLFGGGTRHRVCRLPHDRLCALQRYCAWCSTFLHCLQLLHFAGVEAAAS